MKRDPHLPTVVKAADEGLDPDGGAWVAFCRAHRTLMNQETRAGARSLTTLDFCECCRGACTDGLYGFSCANCGAKAEE